MDYLEHLLDAIWFFRTIFVDVGTEYLVGIFWLDSLLVGLVVSQLLENRLRYVSVQVVYENSLCH
jgi:hypothetical protein